MNNKPYCTISDSCISASDGEHTVILKWTLFEANKKHWLLSDLARIIAQEIEEWNRD